MGYNRESIPTVYFPGDLHNSSAFFQPSFRISSHQKRASQRISSQYKQSVNTANRVSIQQTECQYNRVSIPTELISQVICIIHLHFFSHNSDSQAINFHQIFCEPNVSWSLIEKRKTLVSLSPFFFFFLPKPKKKKKKKKKS